MFRFKGYFESYLIFNTRKSLSMLLWEGHRPQLLPINLRTHARARQPTHPSSLSQAGPTPRQSDVGQVNRMTLARWSGGTQKKKKKQRRRRRKREDSLGGRAWYASALLTRKRSRVAPASPLPQPAATGVGREAPWRWDPHTVVVVAPTGQWQWPGSLARCDATRRWRCGSFFFFFSLFHRPTSPHEVVGLGRGLSKHLVVLLWGRFCLYFFFFYSDPTTATRWRNSAGSGLDVCSPEFIRAAAVGG